MCAHVRSPPKLQNAGQSPRNSWTAPRVRTARPADPRRPGDVNGKLSCPANGNTPLARDSNDHLRTFNTIYNEHHPLHPHWHNSCSPAPPIGPRAGARSPGGPGPTCRTRFVVVNSHTKKGGPGARGPGAWHRGLGREPGARGIPGPGPQPGGPGSGPRPPAPPDPPGSGSRPPLPVPGPRPGPPASGPGPCLGPIDADGLRTPTTDSSDGRRSAKGILEARYGLLHHRAGRGPEKGFLAVA